MNKSEHKKEKDLDIKTNQLLKGTSSFGHKSHDFIPNYSNQDLT
jgi:hypothetical protein